MNGNHLTEFGWHYLLGGFSVLIALIASGHVILYKRDMRAAAGWIGFIWFAPLIGPLLYFVLGINRIRRRAMDLRADKTRFQGSSGRDVLASSEDSERDRVLPEHLLSIARVLDKAAGRLLTSGNLFKPLIDGDEAYPAMLEAIRLAQKSVTLSTYIFDRDAVGLEFAGALGDAVRRGVEVRVLIDSAGTKYSWPSILGELNRQRVRVGRFLPSLAIWRWMSVNLRNHRKILVVDGRLGFMGGMNIRIGHWLSRNPAHPVRDLHFRLEGPVVRQLQQVFAEDWHFTTGETLQGEKWFPEVKAVGDAWVRGIADGPDEDVDPLRWSILSALAAAQKSVRIATPYFLPDAPIISAMGLAALRGVVVEIVLPETNNLPFVHWASQAMWWQVLERGCRIWMTPGVFDHSKLMVVDGCWTLVGSANWDPRSLRLNFEFNVECYDAALGNSLSEWFDAKRNRSREITLQQIDARPLWMRLRDGVARLFSPYL